MEHKDYAVMYIIMETYNDGEWGYLSDDDYSYDDQIVVCKTREDAKKFIEQLEQEQADEFMDYLDVIKEKGYGDFIKHWQERARKNGEEWSLARPKIYRIEEVPYYQ